MSRPNNDESNNKNKNKNNNNKNNNNSNHHHQNWLEFSQSWPDGNLYLHQAAAMLHSMDEAFRCSICRNIFTNPVSVQPCHHAFCNDCIHKALRRRNEDEDDDGDGEVESSSSSVPSVIILRCPYCRNRLDDSIDLAQCIVQNRNFEEASRHYKTLRPLLERALRACTSTSKSSGAAGAAAEPLAMVHSPPPTPAAAAAASTPVIVTTSPAAAATIPVGAAQTLATAGPTPQQEKNGVEKSAAEKSAGADTTKLEKSGGADVKHEDKGSCRSGRRKLRNPFIREQFSLEYSEAKETWCFLCSHCGQVALRSKSKVWNASILTEHIRVKCPGATEEVKQRAAEFTRCKRAPEYNIPRQNSSAAKQQKRSGNHEEQQSNNQQQDGGGPADDSSYEPYL